MEPPAEPATCAHVSPALRVEPRAQDVIGGDSLRAAHEPLLGGDGGVAGATLAVRLAAVDCPRMPSEPLAAEAAQFVIERVLGRDVRLQLVSAGGEKGGRGRFNQHDGVVARVAYRGSILQLWQMYDLSEELLRAGLAKAV